MPAVLADLHEPAFLDDPYPWYAQLRNESPVHYLDSLGIWLVSRHDDVLAVLRDPVRFSSDLASLASGLSVNPFNPSIRVPRLLSGLAGRIPWFRVLLTSDPPAHTVLRRKVTRAFTPRMIGVWEPRIRQITEELVSALGDNTGCGPTDLVGELASPLPTTVIAEMMGIPAERRDDFKRWSDNLVNGLVAGDSVLRLATSAIEIELFFARALRRRRKHPGEDLISLLLAGDADDALSSRELVTFCILLLVAGNETTTNLIANAILALFANPDVLSEMESNPERAEAVIEETLRYDSPGQGLIRVTTADVTIGAVTIPAGSDVLPLIGSANRDPAFWNDPEAFRLDREPNDHLAFGTGIHLCIGAWLARLEGRIALETLFHHRRVRPAGEPVRIQSPVLRGLRSLPVMVQASN